MNAPIPTADNCAKAYGLCMGDPRCRDTSCPGHPVNSCSSCAGGPCPIPQACMQPLAEVPPRIERRIFAERGLLPTTGEGWARLANTTVWTAAAAFFAGHIGRYLGWF